MNFCCGTCQKSATFLNKLCVLFVSNLASTLTLVVVKSLKKDVKISLTVGTSNFINIHYYVWRRSL